MEHSERKEQLAEKLRQCKEELAQGIHDYDAFEVFFIMKSSKSLNVFGD